MDLEKIKDEFLMRHIKEESRENFEIISVNFIKGEMILSYRNRFNPIRKLSEFVEESKNNLLFKNSSNESLKDFTTKE